MISGFWVVCVLCLLLMSYLHTLDIQARGFPLFTRAPIGFRVSYCLPDSLIHSLLLRHTKAQGFRFLFPRLINILINSTYQEFTIDINNYYLIRVSLYSL